MDTKMGGNESWKMFTLHLKRDQTQYLEERRILKIMRKYFQIMDYTTTSFMEKEVINNGIKKWYENEKWILIANLNYKILILVMKKKRRKRKNTLIKKNLVKPTLFEPEILVMMLREKNMKSSTGI